MDVNDSDELLQVTYEESSDSEDQDDEQCFDEEDAYSENFRYFPKDCGYTKCEFLTTKILLIFSSMFSMILLPAYFDSNNIKGDAYNFILITSTLAVLVFTLIFFNGKMFFNSFKNIGVFDAPLKFHLIVIISLIYTFSGFLMIYAVDRKKVMCHLQDPMKGCILVFSLLYYFIFCRKVMGLQRIFSTTTIIVGLFIAVDYGLCDEFRCRGYERVHVSDDTGNWPWKTHSTWIIVYVFGLAMFAGYFTLAERFLLSSKNHVTDSLNTSPSFLTTISRSVAFPVSDSENHMRRSRLSTSLNVKSSAVHLTLYIHLVSWIFVMLSFWTDMIPYIGKNSSISELFNATRRSILCHMEPQTFQTKELNECGNTFFFSWSFLVSYALFNITSLKFLMMTQSAVYTVATISSSLPLVGIWWNLFKLVPLQNGATIILWSPSVSGEFICSILGLPIVLVGLFLFCKSHFRDFYISDTTSNYETTPSQFAI